MLAQEKGLQFYQTRSKAAILFDTLPAECIEKAICMVTTETLHEKRKRKTTSCSQSKFAMWIARSTHTKGKIILGKRCTEFPGVRMQHCGLQNSRHINFSTVQEQDEQRQQKVAQLIEMFESHLHKDQFLKDMSQTKKIIELCEEFQEA